jgi:hypothetical protein
MTTSGVLFEELKQFIDKRSTKQEDHVLWNDFNGSRVEIMHVPNLFGLPKRRYCPYELLRIVENQVEIPPNTKLTRTCEFVNCIRHFSAVQYGLCSVVEMDSSTYEETCARFEAHCQPKNLTTNCINWNGFVKGGYGQFSLFGHNKPAHCAAWELANNDDVPEGQIVRHLCPVKNRLCVNPDHLTTGTIQQNAQDEVDGGYTRKGSKHPLATISEETAQKIIDSFGNGKTAKERELEFKVPRDTIYSIDAARGWRHRMTPEQIKERESVVRRAVRTTSILSDEVVQQITDSSLTQEDCAGKYKTTIAIVQRIQYGKYMSTLERNEIGFTNMIAKLAKQSVVIKDEETGIQHQLFKGNASQDANAVRYQISYFGKLGFVARVSFMAHNKLTELPEGKVVRHLCRFKHCVSIDCLELGTYQDNAHDRLRDGTSGRGEKSPLATITEELATKIKQTKGVCTSRTRSLFFNVPRTLIMNMDCGASWKHLVVDSVDVDLVEELRTFAAQHPRKKARLV